MSAIVTTKFRLENAASFIGSVSSNSVYVGIGKSDKWSEADIAPAPVDTIVEENDFWANAIAFKRVLAPNVTNIARRITWTSGSPYAAWNDADKDIFTKDFYVLNDSNNCVYKCIVAGASTSVNKPEHTTGPDPVFYGDGYAWQYMYALDSDLATKFLMTNYMPVKVATNASGVTPTEQNNYDYQQSCLTGKGRIYRYVVTAGGSGYTAAPTVTINGNGSGAAATAIVSGGQVTSVIVTGTNSGTAQQRSTALSSNAGTNYTTVFITLSGGNGSGATVSAVLSPGHGHGTDPVTELGGYYVGIRSLLTGAEGSGDFIVNNQFRQIAIVKNPYVYNTTTPATDNTLSSLYTLDLGTSIVHAFTVGDTFTQIGGTGAGAVGIVDSFEKSTVNNHWYLKYHQNDSTGYKQFTDDSTRIQSTNGTAEGEADIATNGVLPPEIQPYSGKVMFVESRAPISRTASQIEDIRLILEF